MALDIFEHTFGDALLPRLDDETRPQIAMQMLDCIQMVVNVLADEENDGYAVQFAPTMSAYTEHNKRRITISGMPLFNSAPGTPLRDIAAVMTGFAIHEVGHTKRVGIIDAVRAVWPDKVLPKTLGNIIEDVVLEARVIERYAGFRDVFVPTLEWVAEATCPKHTLTWEGTTGHKVNLAGQIVRYEPFVTFDTDPITEGELRWWKEWSGRITARTTPEQGVEMVREALAHLAAQREATPEVEPPVPPKDGEGGCEFPIPPEPKGGLPDEEDDDEPEPKGKGEGKGTEPGEGEDPDGEDGEAEDGDEDGGTEGGGDSEDGEDGDGETEGGDTEGDDDDTEDGEGNGPKGGSDAERETDSTEGDDETDGPGKERGDIDTDVERDDTPLPDERIEADKGSIDTEGAGGSGQGIAEAGNEDPDAGLDPTELDKSFDDLSVTDNAYRDHVLDSAIAEERTTTRMDAGKHGKMKVVWQ